MLKKLTKKERQILDNLDRIIAGQHQLPPASYLEEKLLQALAKIRQSEARSESERENIAELISNISHQLKTPLSALSVHLELAADAALCPGEQEEALAECRIQTDRIRFLSDAMFKAVRLESGLIAVRKIRADLAATIRAAIETIRPALAAKGLSLRASVPDSLLLPHDPVWTKEAFVNLLDNAVKYTKTGTIGITLEQGALYTRIDFSDTGIGIPSSAFTLIFSRFYRASIPGTERVEGTGLGLSIAREILRQQQGNITVSSTVGQGSVFSVFLQNR